MAKERVGPARGTDRWDSGDAYERYVGRWSRLVAREFLRWLAIPPGGRWLDVGCGTGVLIQSILDHAGPRGVVGIDPSASYVAFARDRVSDARARFEVGEGQALQVPTAAYDAAVAGLVLNFVPQADRAVAEMTRAVRQGGTVAAYVWDYADGMQMMRRFWDAAVALDPGARELDEGERFELCEPEPLSRLFRAAGLGEVEVRAIEVPTDFRNFDDFWSPFLGGQGPAPSYAMSLSEERRAELREQIRADLPIDEDGPIALVARAWAVRGRR
ncbi:MAG: methyltransferase domain-containing protein [Actinomycetota bacterium]|nr:methyltransferase domain-containing protein [Actinomycetota bacterium]